jgi:site-specific recombinase XerD
VPRLRTIRPTAEELAAWTAKNPTFTKRYLTWLATQADPNRDYLVFSDVAGLGARVARSGKVWLLYQRRQKGGRTFRESFGAYPGFSLDTAIERTEKRNGERVDRDLHELHPSRRARAAARRAAALRTRAPTLRELVRKYVTDPDITSGRTARYLGQLGRRILGGSRRGQPLPGPYPSLLDVPIDQLTRDQLEEGWLARNKSMRRHVATHVKRLFRWAKDRRLVAINPVADAPLPARTPSRPRYFDEREVLVFWGVLDQLAPLKRARMRVQLLTMVRGEEVAGMRWAELREGVEERVGRLDWLVPASRMKAKLDHLVPLSAAAEAIIRGIPRVSDLVFGPSGRPPRIQSVKEEIDRLLAAAGEQFEDWVPHDLRRSASNLLARRGVLPAVISKLLAHERVAGISDTDKVYLTYAYQKERAAALELLGNFFPGATPSAVLPAPPPLEPPPPQRSLRLLSAPALNGELILPVPAGDTTPTAAVEHAELRSFKIAMILAHPDVGDANRKLRRKRVASDIVKRYGDRALHSVIIPCMAWLLAEAMLCGVTVVRRRELEAIRKSWIAHHPDEDLLNDEMLHRIDILMASPLVVDYLPSGAENHPATRAKALQIMLTACTASWFTSPAPVICSVYVRVATGLAVVSPRLSHRRVKGQTVLELGHVPRLKFS